MPGLDGLRAIAVGAVLLYHSDLTWMPGGYLGVDVFFVISGYLITSLLTAEHALTGTIVLRTFWRRRARRLLPGLYGMVAIVTVASALFYRGDLAELRGQLAPSFTYWTNWFLISSHQSYFAAIGRPPVLQHLWSLAVEEQFYLLWPVVLLAQLRAFRGRTGPVATVTAAAVLASVIAMSVQYSPVGDPSRVYYGSDTRASGLLLGALLAILWRPGAAAGPPIRRARRGPLRAIEGVGLVSLVGVICCFFVMGRSQPWLYPGGFIVVSLLTVVLVAVVVHPTARLGQAGLGNGVLTWLGKRSYGVYLWHWPIFVFTRPGIDVPWGPYPTLVLRLALTGTAATLSYRYIEQPIRNGALVRWVGGLRGPVTRLRQRRRRATTFTILGTTLVVAVTAFGLVAATRPLTAVERSIRFGQAATPPSSRILSQASNRSTPTTSPADVAALPPTVADPHKTMTVIADSVLLSDKQTLVSELGAAGWQVEYRGHPALMINDAVKNLKAAGTPVGSVAVVGIGYNSLWQHQRANFAAWSDKFDAEAESLLTTLKSLGATTIVWVTLREPSLAVVPPSGRPQYVQYAWFFPYVNERLHALHRRHPDLLLADWAAISNKPGVAYDAIHLNSEGSRLMTDLIRSTLGI